MRIVPLAEAATLGETSAGLMVTFGIALAVVLLVLAAQFESFVSAVIVMATVPRVWPARSSRFWRRAAA
ncbi:hypothetical protein MASR1M32_13960 [Rhodobacter sp.]